jgi:hypothetical protein
MTPDEAVKTILAEDPEAELHWTVVLDRALVAGYVTPGPEARNEIVRALADAAKTGAITKTDTGTYRCA